MTDTGPLKCLDGPRRVTGDFQKPTVIFFLSNGERIEREWFVLFQEFQEQISVFFTYSVMLLHLLFVVLSIFMAK